MSTPLLLRRPALAPNFHPLFLIFQIPPPPLGEVIKIYWTMEGSQIKRQCDGGITLFEALMADIFPSTFLQLVSSSKNWILNWVMKLNLFMFILLCIWKTLERLSILFTYSSYSLVYILIDTHKGTFYVSF